MTLRCADFEELASELALGILPGDDRAAAIAHLDHCPSCRELVASLTGVVDTLLECGPVAAPPDGFEDRVIARLEPVQPAHPVQRTQPSRPRPSRDRRRVRALRATLATAAAVVALAIVGPVIGGGEERVSAAPMRTGHAEIVGTASIHDGDEPKLVVSVPGWSERVERYGAPADSYSIVVEHADRPDEVLALGSIDADEWQLDIGGSDVEAVAIVDRAGRVWCRGEF